MVNTRLRVITALGIMAILLVLLNIGNEPEEDLTVDQLVSSGDQHDGEAIRIHGQVVVNSLDIANDTMMLSGEEHQVRINFAGLALPDGLSEGKTISVRGDVGNDAGERIVHAMEIKTGCPSKYQAEANTAGD
jgi:cytochrome c-type biogenesis protein CcmE